jgi:hypothetical protein
MFIFRSLLLLLSPYMIETDDDFDAMCLLVGTVSTVMVGEKQVS